MFLIEKGTKDPKYDKKFLIKFSLKKQLIMFKRVKQRVTIKFDTLSVEKEFEGTLCARYSRRSQCGMTNSKVDNKEHVLQLNSAFVIDCNFKLKRGEGWKDKIANIEVFWNDNDHREKIAKWDVNLAFLFNSLGKELDLETNDKKFGHIVLKIKINKGDTTKKAARGAHTPIPTPPKPIIESSKDDDKSALKDDPFEIEIKDQLKVMGANLKYDNGLSTFGINVLDTITNQPRGANLNHILSTIANALEIHADKSLQMSLYAFHSICYIYTELKFIGITTETPAYNIRKAMECVFDKFMDKLLTIYYKPMLQNDVETIETINNLIASTKGNAFSDYLANVIYFDVVHSTPFSIQDKLVSIFGIHTFQEEHCNLFKKDEPPPGRDEIQSRCHELLLSSPIPSLEM